MLLLFLNVYIVLLALGAVGYIFAVKIFPNFIDKGYGFAKILSLLAITYIFWIVGIPGTRLTLWFAIIVFGCFFFIPKMFDKQIFSKETLKVILVEELLFIVLFGAMVLFRTAVPKIEGIEKFMDFAIINGLLRSETRTPVDVWFSGHTINYYYFGHLMLANFIKLINVSSGIGYNLAVALIFALSGTAAFSLGLNLTRKYFVALFSVLLLLVAGNLDFFYHQVILKSQDYFYAQARSIIEFTINEFPAYSFLISDLHAHILAIPLVLLVVALLFQLYLDGGTLRRALWIVVPLTLGSLFVTNSWDFMIYVPLFILVRFVVLWQKDKLSFSFVSESVLLLVLSVVLYLPFYLHFNPATYGISFHSVPFTIQQNLRMFGYYIFCVAPFVLLFLMFKKFRAFSHNTFVFLCVLYASILLIVPQFISLNDIYFKLNPPYTRANTVFKFWYQAWILFALVAPYCLWQFYSFMKRKLIVGIYAVGFAVITFYVLKYAVISVQYIVGPNYVSHGLDGTSYLSQNYADELAVINWINNHVQGQPVLLEAAGESYTMGSLTSSYTGLPTLVGWASHELGWRGDWDPIARRMGDIEKIYKSSSMTEVSELVNEYNIKYIIVSNKERSAYGDLDTSAFMLISTSVFQQGSAVLWRVN